MSGISLKEIYPFIRVSYSKCTLFLLNYVAIYISPSTTYIKMNFLYTVTAKHDLIKLSPAGLTPYFNFIQHQSSDYVNLVRS